MRSKLVLLLIVCQLLVLGVMAGKREHIRAFGNEIYLRTAPLDPRDPLRGDFVRLRYALSSVNPQHTRGTVAQHRNNKDYTVYAVLKPDVGGIYGLDYLTDIKPAPQQIFIKGYISDDWRLVGWTGTAIGVRYGIEQYFVEQGQGLKMEAMLGQRNELQIPMEVRVALGTDGTAVIKDYRWSSLGIKLEMLRINNRNLNTQATPSNLPLSPQIKITLRNVSTQALTLANQGLQCGFVLLAVESASQHYPATDQSCAQGMPQKNALITLQPLEEYSVELDLSTERWHIISDGKSQEIGALPTPEMFRIVYRSPDDAQIHALGSDYNVWRGELPSQAFNAFGQID